MPKKLKDKRWYINFWFGTICNHIWACVLSPYCNLTSSKFSFESIFDDQPVYLYCRLYGLSKAQISFTFNYFRDNRVFRKNPYFYGNVGDRSPRHFAISCLKPKLVDIIKKIALKSKPQLILKFPKPIARPRKVTPLMKAIWGLPYELQEKIYKETVKGQLNDRKKKKGLGR